MRYLPLLAMLLPAVVTEQSPAVPRSNMPVIGKAPAKAHCERPGARRVGDAPPPGVRKLGEMPPAKPIYTVVREIDGCPIPVSVRAR
ncbi:hypothetical protein M9979_00315 [Sphingomonas sp. RP10(2022)]|uniref:Uncharacterized protein n=1 Tax=Sphingomonas liriopis TaxID=2949094 RepID=A0A9X2HLV8_9SPHN|nr:hypothetical protein [Sphingomonas liriopis]MCP3733328.1 hypothetical protein [Sphingomonas liriopis]